MIKGLKMSITLIKGGIRSIVMKSQPSTFLDLIFCRVFLLKRITYFVFLKTPLSLGEITFISSKVAAASGRTLLGSIKGINPAVRRNLSESEWAVFNWTGGWLCCKRPKSPTPAPLPSLHTLGRKMPPLRLLLCESQYFIYHGLFIRHMLTPLLRVLICTSTPLHALSIEYRPLLKSNQQL